MTPPPRGSRRALRPRLAVLLALVLSIAILPLGLISVFQTNRVLNERQSLSKTALLERTQQAASASQDIIRSAMSSAETLAILVTVFQSGNRACDEIMANVVERSAFFVFAGYLDNDMGFSCASLSHGGLPDGKFTRMSGLETGSKQVLFQPLEFLGGIATVSVTVPVLEDGRPRGTVLVVIPTSALSAALADPGQGVDLVLLEQDGALVATEDFSEDRRSVLPAGQALHDLLPLRRTTFRAQNREGEIRDFAILPIAEGRVFVLGSWAPRQDGMWFPAYQEAAALYFPILIWVIVVAVAYVGVHRLVIRHVRRLQSWMRIYSSGDGHPGEERLDNAPEELEVVAEAFRDMTRRLQEQEDEREEDLREKNLLLREIHHRVKNNLQLISSMMNMQIRATDSPEAKRLLRHVQDRVMALAAIHRYLYMARKLSMVRADKLLDEIIRQLIIVGTPGEAERIAVATQLDPVEISPDKSVPLSLLATEAAMNAVKYCGVPGVDEPWINIALKAVDDDTLCLSVVNSRGQDGSDHREPSGEGSGLGSQLIRSFVNQLGGGLDVKVLPDRFELHATFPRAWNFGEDADDSPDMPLPQTKGT